MDTKVDSVTERLGGLETAVRKLISRAEIDRVNAKHGIKRAAPDDLIYSEGPSIMFETRPGPRPIIHPPAKEKDHG